MVSAADLLMLGQRALARGDCNRALECFNACARHARLETNHECASLWASRAAVLNELQRSDEAELDADRALKHKRLHLTALWQRACALENQHRLNEAIQCFEMVALVHLSCADDARHRINHLRVKLASTHCVAIALQPSKRNEDAQKVRLAVQDHGPLLAAVCSDGRLSVFNAEKCKNIISEQMRASPTRITWIRCSDMLVLGDLSGHVHVMDCAHADDACEVHWTSLTTSGDSNHAITALTAVGCEHLVAYGSEDGFVCVVDIVRSKQIFARKGHERIVNAMSSSPSGQMIASASNDGCARIWDACGKIIAFGECVHELRWGDAFVSDVHFSPCGRFVTTIAHNGYQGMYRLLLWSAKSGRICRWFDGHQSIITSMTLLLNPGSKSAGLAATASLDGSVRVWNLEAEPIGQGSHDVVLDTYKGQSISRHGCVHRLNEGAILDTSSSRHSHGLLACAFRDGALRVFDCNDYYNCFVELQACKEGSITSVEWMRNTGKVVTAGSDGSASVFAISNSGDGVQKVLEESKR